jgi:hypothetical protein
MRINIKIRSDFDVLWQMDCSTFRRLGRYGGIMTRPLLNSVVEFGAQKIKVLFSHENKALHSILVPELKSYLAQELKREVEVISRFEAWETFYAVTDNVFDLVILAESYAASDLSSLELVRRIKKLDRNIAVIQFLEQEQDESYPREDSSSRSKTAPLLSIEKYFHRN